MNLNTELKDLFSYVPPEQLRKSIHEIFVRYLQTIDNVTDLEHFKLLAEDSYFLYRFLEKAKKKWGEKKNALKPDMKFPLRIPSG